MTTNRIRPDAGFADREALPKGPNGCNLCRQCGKECPGKSRTFCSKSCVEEWKIRSQPGFVRAKLRERDGEVCRSCGLNAKAFKGAVSMIGDFARQPYMGLRPGIPEIATLYRTLVQLLRVEGRRHYWDADHIVEVVNGGGECGLDNYQTLCVWCHRAKKVEKQKR